jgi:hypothetical protein
MEHIPTSSETCEHERCECVVSGNERVERGGHAYCSEGCADGTGCDHEQCNCRDKH